MKIRTNYTFNSNSASPMFWNVASARELQKRSGCAAHLRTFKGSFGCKNALGWQHCFFTQSRSQGWANLFDGRVICTENRKHQRAAIQRWADCEVFQSKSSPDPMKLNPIQSWSAKFLKIIGPIHSWSANVKSYIFILPHEAKELRELFCL